MKNKNRFKKCAVLLIIFSVILISTFLGINSYEYNKYTENFNAKLTSIINLLGEKYPNLSQTDIVEILNNHDNTVTNILKEYGIDSDKQSIVLENDKYHSKFLVVNFLCIFTGIVIISLIFFNYNKKKDRDINNLIKYLERIKRNNYELDINCELEGELAILKSEIAKTVTNLKNTLDNLHTNRINIKKSLEDISHQLKTPLTSILIDLDNIIYNPTMDVNTKNNSMKDIRRKTYKMNFLVQEILKLSKFDAGVINFARKDVLVGTIIDEAIKNISSLCDLKNITIERQKFNQATINCDFKWQIEAITNIIKNCAEHSFENSKIIINCKVNKVYTSITIQDFAGGIDKSDLPHIFERFYTGKNYAEDSTGIGLSLAKLIIENDNGNIYVETDNEGSTFEIRYYKI